MSLKLSSVYKILPEVTRALANHGAIVALESAVITHGLPHPVNLSLAREVERIIRDKMAMPATISLIHGKLKIGTTEDELEELSTAENLIKVSVRNVGIGIAQNRSGGTTVAATLLAARTAGIKVFSTGGIGGVHRGNSTDVSADMDELAQSPLIVVCAGAKSILDLPATLEALETRGVPVLGYGTDEFPAFYTRSSGLAVDARVNSPGEVVEIANAHWKAGNRSAILVCNPLPLEQSLDNKLIDEAIRKAVESADKEGIKGKELTPYLLDLVSKFTKGKSLEANLALLKNNAALAAEIALLSVSEQVSYLILWGRKCWGKCRKQGTYL